MSCAPLLALFVRSLREDARSRATYWARAGLGGFLLLVMLLFAVGNSWSNAPGRVFFTTVIAFQLLAITLMGLSYFSSAVAEEKEEQTLGLLRMTDLSPLSILLGKSTSRLCGALCLLAAQFPFTIIAVTFGGISLGQVVAAYCAVGAFTFLLCNLALLGSVISRGVAGAAAFCIATLGLLLAVVPLLYALQKADANYFHWNAPFGSVATGIWSATPIARLQEVLGTGYSRGALGWQVWTNIIFGIVCFLLAWAAFQRFCEREPGTVPSLGRPLPAAEVVSAVAQPRRRARVSRVWANALAWKDFHYLYGGRAGFVARTAVYGGVFLFNCWTLITRGTTTWTFGINTVSYPLLPVIFSIDVAVMAARIFRTELRDQTFSSLAILPGDMRDIVHRKVQACLLAAAPGFVCSIALQILFPFFMGDNPVLKMPQGSLLIAVGSVAGWLNKTLLLVLIAWLSLYMKRGALPAGFLISLVVNALVSIIIYALVGSMLFAFSTKAAEIMIWVPLVCGLLSVAGAGVLYFLGLQRLQELAGEE